MGYLYELRKVCFAPQAKRWRTFLSSQKAFEKQLRTGNYIKWTKIAPELGLSSRRAKGCPLYVFGLWGSAEDDLKDKQDGSVYLILSLYFKNII
jgi:hypothetical protein